MWDIIVKVRKRSRTDISESKLEWSEIEGEKQNTELRGLFSDGSNEDVRVSDAMP